MWCSSLRHTLELKGVLIPRRSGAGVVNGSSEGERQSERVRKRETETETDRQTETKEEAG